MKLYTILVIFFITSCMQQRFQKNHCKYYTTEEIEIVMSALVTSTEEPSSAYSRYLDRLHQDKKKEITSKYRNYTDIVSKALYGDSIALSIIENVQKFASQASFELNQLIIEDVKSFNGNRSHSIQNKVIYLSEKNINLYKQKELDYIIYLMMLSVEEPMPAYQHYFIEQHDTRNDRFTDIAGPTYSSIIHHAILGNEEAIKAVREMCRVTSGKSRENCLKILQYVETNKKPDPI